MGISRCHFCHLCDIRIDDTMPTYRAEHHNITVVLFDLIYLALRYILSSPPRFTRSSLSHSSHWRCWGRAWAGWRIPGPDTAPGVSERSKGGGHQRALPHPMAWWGCSAFLAPTTQVCLDGHCIPGYSAWGKSERDRLRPKRPRRRNNKEIRHAMP